jgi:aryl-alcohol dehydrogenase-like predicted oxidoreductase
MKYAELPNIEKELSVVCLGTAYFGSNISVSDSFKLLDKFAELGGTFIDTAHCYAEWYDGGYNGGSGNSEKVIGEWLARTGMAKKIASATKGGHGDLETGASRINPGDINTQISESLERLKTDSIDMYWLHMDVPSIPAGEILGMLAGHVAAGTLKAIGCSNWSIRRQAEASAAAAELGLPGFIASQVGWSLAWQNQPVQSHAYGDTRHMDPEMLAYHVETGVPVAAYNAQASGFFAGKYDGLDFGAPDFPKPSLANQYGSDVNFRRRSAAVELAGEAGCTANQLALAWLLHHPFPVFPIVGPNSIAQMDDTMKAGDVELSDEAFERLTCRPESTL